MFVVICCMLSGVAVGLIFRRRNMSFVQRAVTILIWLLLFLLGVEVGSDSHVMGSLGTLGVEALVLALSGVIGCALLCKLVFRKEG